MAVQNKAMEQKNVFLNNLHTYTFMGESVGNTKVLRVYVCLRTYTQHTPNLHRIICDAIKTNGNVTAKTLAVTLAVTMAVSARTIERELNFLRKEGYITKEGKANKGVWKLFQYLSFF